MENKLVSKLPRLSLVFFLVAIICFLQLPANFIIKSVSLTGGILVNEILIIAGLPLMIAYFFRFDKSRLFPFTTPKFSTWVMALLLTIPVALLIDYGAKASESIFPIPAPYREVLDQLMAFKGPYQFILKFFLLAIVPGFCEEIFFRGFCQNSFEAKWGKNIAIIVTAVLFAVLHGNPWYIHLYLVLGFFLSWVYALSRTLWIPITCHILNNAWTFINHALGVEYPLKGFTDFVDLIIITAVIVFGIILAYNYHQITRRT